MKTINKTLTHGEIYELALSLIQSFNDVEMYLPAAVAFSIQKNKKNIVDIATEIDNVRIEILNRYKNPDLDLGPNEIRIEPEYIEQANKELNDLLAIQTEIKIYTFKIEELEGISFTPSQIQSILFMIDED